MTRRRPPTWITTAAGWVGGKVRDLGDWALGPQLDDHVCRLSRELGGDDD